jgi:hypothetical protein
MRRLTRGVPTALAGGLLAFQTIVPWTARNYITMDGPSHLYNARVVGEVLFHPASPYRKFYRLRSALSTNWGSVLVFNLASRFTVAHAEQIVASISVLAAFACFFYLLRSLDPETPCSPVINFVTITWFLWVGFYNFYLGMALFALAVGFYIRNSERLSWRRAIILSLLLGATFFTHILPAALALMVIGIIAIWMRFLGRRLVPTLLVATVPTCLLLGSFVLNSREGITVRPDVVQAWKNFPSIAFTDTFRKNPSGTYLYPVIVAFLVLGILSLRRSEWSSARGALAAATGVCYALYLVVPAHGFGGDDINTRMAWSVFVLGCAVAASGSRMQRLLAPVAVYVAAILGVQLYQSMNRNVRAVSVALKDYEAATENIPAGATVVRIHFDTVGVSRHYGYRGLALDPVYHADAWMAARQGFVDLSDYQALSQLFTLECAPPITDRQRADLWRLESGDENAISTLHGLLEDFPAPIDYVLVLGDPHGQDLGLDQNMALTATTGNGSLLSVYRRKER